MISSHPVTVKKLLRSRVAKSLRSCWPLSCPLRAVKSVF